MNYRSRNISEAIEGLRIHNSTLREIDLYGKRLCDDEVTQLIDVLLLYPNIVTYINLRYNRLTDVTGVKLAHYIATSTTIRRLDLEYNEFSEMTYLAIAAALRINTSLRSLIISGCPTNRSRIDTAFIEALHVNPVRPSYSEWLLYDQVPLAENDFWRFLKITRELGHPNVQSLLSADLDRMMLR